MFKVTACVDGILIHATKHNDEQEAYTTAGEVCDNLAYADYVRVTDTRTGSVHDLI